MPRRSEIPYGPIIVVRGEYEGSVGIYDDDEGRAQMLVYLYRGVQAPSVLAFIAGGADFAAVRARDVRIPTPQEAAAILALIQSEFPPEQLFEWAKGGLLELAEHVGVDAGIGPDSMDLRPRPPRLRLVTEDDVEDPEDPPF